MNEKKKKPPITSKKKAAPTPAKKTTKKVAPKKKTEEILYPKKIYENLSKIILQFISGKKYAPLGQVALLKRLNITKDHLPLCKKILSDLIEQNILESKNKQITLKVEKEETVTGILHMHARGFGFVTPDSPSKYEEDIFIPKNMADSAVDGDKVEVLVNPNSNWEKGPDGKVVSVLKRGRSHLAGTIKVVDAQGFFVCFCPLLGTSKPVICENPEDLPVKIGERVILKVKKWGDEQERTRAEILYSMGHIDNPSCDIPCAIEEFDLEKAFSIEALEEAKKFGKTVSKKDLKGRTNLTETPCFTIDPDTAKDYDDALSLTKDKKGIYHLAVHIADVAHYVKEGSFLDKEAKTRCNSTYFPNFCLPMLPEELSNQLCSLKANVIRLTASVLMDFDKEGTLLKYEIVRGYIKSAKRFTYGDARRVLDGKLKSAYKDSLMLMQELCLLLKKKRRERGSIDFSLPETVIEVDPNGVPTGLKTIEYDITHQLVEEFMLKANETVAKHLSDAGKTLLFRVHDAPPPENLADFYTLAASFGFTLPKEPEAADLQQLFEEAKGKPYAEQLAVAFIRSMKLAYYSPNNVGHFGLSLEHYCHFTSPIRRYSDLIIQRLLFDEQIEEKKLNEVALLCSNQERVSFKAEMSVKTLKKLRLLKSYLEEDPYREFKATVTRVKAFGLQFEASPVPIEGFLHVSELEDDYFVYDERRGVLVGKYNGKIHAIGETLLVRIKTLDLILQETAWELVTKRKPKERSKERQRRRR